MTDVRRRPTRAILVRLAVLGVLGLVLAGCGSSGVPDVSVKVGDGQAASGNGQFALSLQLLVVLTVLSIVPAVLMLATSFTRIVVVLSLLRSAIGIPNLPPNQVLLGLSLFLTLFVMAPVISKVNADAVQPYMNHTISDQAAIDRGIGPFRDFMLSQTREQDLAVFVDLSKGRRPATPQDVPTEVLLPAFVVSELKTAFTMGFLLYVPFLVIDLVVASALMSMGMMMVSPVQIALPFKLLLFVLVDGWVLVVQSLVRSFG
ncbi:MAG TPA: flagellar type III secretion system pore protein FliP [Candidatus Limnocylindrales bacterium]